MTEPTAGATGTPSFARLESLQIRLYEIKTLSHLRVGAGEGTAALSAVDGPIIRALWYDGQERRVPYIPGSSLHGVREPGAGPGVPAGTPGSQAPREEGPRRDR